MMYRYVKSIFICLAAFCQILHATRWTTGKLISRTARQIIDNRYNGKAQEQFVNKKLARLIRLTRSIDVRQPVEPRIMTCILDALYFTGQFVSLHQNIGILDRAIPLFSQTPGFVPTIMKLFRNIKNDKLVKGTCYELETAVILLKEKKLPITAFNKIKRAGTKARQFDLETTNQDIECKAVRWNILPRSWTNKIKRQLLEEKVIVEMLNRKNHNHRRFILYSKYNLTDDMTRWMQLHNIPFVESKSQEV